MQKRVFSLLLIFVLLLTGVDARFFQLAEKSETYASADYSRKAETIGETRGCIYDRNLQLLVNTRESFTSVIKPTAQALLKVEKLSKHDQIEKELREGKLVITPVTETAKLKGCDDILTLKTFSRYNGSLACHLIGYLSADGSGVSGLEKAYDSYFKENGGTLTALYHTDALGRVLNGDSTEIRDENYDSSAGIVLTIDRDVQLLTEKALQNNKIDVGAAVVLEVESGDILACASTPVFDRDNMGKSLASDKSPFLNRALTAYSVGSVFKAVTAAAAIDSGNGNLIYTCKGRIKKSGNVFNCNKLDGHGTLDLKGALAASCNTYFIELATRVGAKKLLSTAEDLGFGQAIDLGNGIKSDQGELPELKALNSDAAVGNLGFGQGQLLATPLQLAACYLTIASGGVYRTPRLIKGTLASDGSLTSAKQSAARRVLSKATCSKLKVGLQAVVDDGTGKNAKSWLYSTCGKTATAQSGWIKNGKEVLHSWFVGFFPADHPKYVICVFKENGVAGSSDDAPVFKEIAEELYALMRSR